MFWKRLERLFDKAETNRKEIMELWCELRRVNSKTNTALVNRPMKGLANAYTRQYPTSDLVEMLFDHLELQVRHTEENYKLEKREERDE